MLDNLPGRGRGSAGREAGWEWGIYQWGVRRGGKLVYERKRGGGEENATTSGAHGMLDDLRGGRRMTDDNRIIRWREGKVVCGQAGMW
jgi:hypothetical protein